jgi:hypothetical protein
MRIRISEASSRARRTTSGYCPRPTISRTFPGADEREPLSGARRGGAAIPLGRVGYVNGQEIIVDGGFEHMLMSLVPRPGFERGN